MWNVSKEDRKDFIADAATKVFSDKGYQVSSLQEVASEVGISKAGIYYYFKSKQELLAYILIRNSDVFLDLLKKTLKENKKKNLTPLESLKILMQVYAFHINKDKHKRRLVLQERHQLTASYQKKLYKREQAIFRLLRSELQKIQEIDERINLNVITFLFISMSHWLGYWFKEGKGLNLFDIIEQNIFIILNGAIDKNYGLDLLELEKRDNFLESDSVD